MKLNAAIKMDLFLNESIKESDILYIGEKAPRTKELIEKIALQRTLPDKPSWQDLEDAKHTVFIGVRLFVLMNFYKRNSEYERTEIILEKLRRKFSSRRFLKIEKKIFGSYSVVAIIDCNEMQIFNDMLKNPKSDLYKRCHNKISKELRGKVNSDKFKKAMLKIYDELTGEVINVRYFKQGGQKTGPKTNYPFNFLIYYLTQILSGKSESAKFSKYKLISGFLEEQVKYKKLDAKRTRSERSFYSHVERLKIDRKMRAELQRAYESYSNLYTKNSSEKIAIDRSLQSQRILQSQETGRKYIAFPEWNKLFKN